MPKPILKQEKRPMDLDGTLVNIQELSAVDEFERRVPEEYLSNRRKSKPTMGVINMKLYKDCISFTGNKVFKTFFVSSRIDYDTIREYYVFPKVPNTVVLCVEIVEKYYIILMFQSDTQSKKFVQHVDLNRKNEKMNKKVVYHKNSISYSTVKDLLATKPSDADLLARRLSKASTFDETQTRSRSESSVRFETDSEKRKKKAMSSDRISVKSPKPIFSTTVQILEPGKLPTPEGTHEPSVSSSSDSEDHHRPHSSIHFDQRPISPRYEPSRRLWYNPVYMNKSFSYIPKTPQPVFKFARPSQTVIHPVKIPPKHINKSFTVSPPQQRRTVISPRISPSRESSMSPNQHNRRFSKDPVRIEEIGNDGTKRIYQFVSDSMEKEKKILKDKQRSNIFMKQVNSEGTSSTDSEEFVDYLGRRRK